MKSNYLSNDTKLTLIHTNKQKSKQKTQNKTKEDVHEQSKPDARWTHVVVWNQRKQTDKQNKQNHIKQEQLRGRKVECGIECLLKVKENKTKTEHLISVT